MWIIILYTCNLHNTVHQYEWKKPDTKDHIYIKLPEKQKADQWLPGARGGSRYWLQMDTGKCFRVMKMFSNWIVVDSVNSRSLLNINLNCTLIIGEFCGVWLCLTKAVKNYMWCSHAFFPCAYENIYSVFQIWGTILESCEKYLLKMIRIVFL